MKKSVLIIIAAVVVIIIAGIALFFGMQIDMEKARAIALRETGDSSSEIVEEKIDKEFLSTEYEFKLVSDQMEYDVNVSAFGQINSFEKEKRKTGITPTDPNAPSNPTTTSDIGIDKAKEIALSKHTQGQITDFDRDQEAGKLLYEVEVTEGETQYDYTIDGTTGDILSTKQESIYE